jgi:superfamily II DNA or RNA helicase
VLRKYQDDCLASVVKAFDGGTTRQLATMATGTGKTVVFANLVSALGDRIPGQLWVLAHREELIDQAVAKIREWNPSLIVDKEMAEHYANPMADVIVSSVASIGRKGTKRADRFDWESVTKVVIDEAHHTPASTYQNFLELAGIMQRKVTTDANGKVKEELIPTNAANKLLLGVTATPARGDGKALASTYQKIVYTYAMRAAIEDGWLVDLRGYRVNTKTSLDEVKTTAGDFQVDQLSDTVNSPERNTLIVKAWQDKAAGLQTVVFTVDIKHAMDLAAMYRQLGIKAAAVWGDDPDRALKLKQHKGRELNVLCNCGVLTEGYDDWRIGCIVLARPTKSSTLYTQMVGRGTRLQDGTGNLIEALTAGKKLDKTECIVIDICDTTSRHSLQTVPTLLGLDSELDLKGELAVKSAAAIEKAQEENPHIDLRRLRDITQLKAHIESVNLFDVSYPPEVENNSKLSWNPTADGGYALLLPNKERVQIKQNMMDEWDITAVIHGQKFRGVRPTFEAAISAADAIVEKYAQNDMKILRRVEDWHQHKATPPQKNLLRKLYKGRVFPFCVCKLESNQPLCPTCKAKTDLSKGHAGRLISAAIASRPQAHA